MQLTLDFDAPRSVPVSTSIDAAESMRPCAALIRERVIHAIRDAGERGRTDAELVDQLGMRENTVRARRVELRDKGQVVDSGRRRPTSTGRAAIVWVATVSLRANSSPPMATVSPPGDGN